MALRRHKDIIGCISLKAEMPSSYQYINSKGIREEGAGWGRGIVLTYMLTETPAGCAVHELPLCPVQSTCV